MNELSLAYEWVMSHIWMSHVSHRNKACLTYECHTYEWVMSNMWMSHVKHVNKSRIWMSHVPDMDGSCLTYEWVIARMCMSRALHVNESWLKYKGLMSRIEMSHVTHIDKSSLMYMYTYTHTHTPHTHQHTHNSRIFFPEESRFWQFREGVNRQPLGNPAPLGYPLSVSNLKKKYYSQGTGTWGPFKMCVRV